MITKVINVCVHQNKSNKQIYFEIYSIVALDHFIKFTKYESPLYRKIIFTVVHILNKYFIYNLL